MSRPVQIFIAYSRKDSALLDELRTHFKPLVRTNKVHIWYDGLIEPGAVWEADIKKHLHASDIILLLVSADAIASDHFYDKEMADALERHHTGEARVVPMIMRPCTWDATPLADLQALPKNGKPVTTWPDRDEAYADAVRSLWNTVKNIEQLKEEQAAEALRLKQEAEAAGKEAERQQKEEARRKQEAAEQANHQEEDQRRREAESQRRRQEEERRQKEESERKALLARQAEYARHIAEAQKHLRRRDWSRAKSAAQAALALAPDDANALHLISLAEEGSRQPAPPKPPYLQWAAIAAGALLALFIIVKVASGPGKESETEQTERAYAEAWRKAETENTLPAWRGFLAAWPEGTRQEEARRRMEELDDKFINLVQSANALKNVDKDIACQYLRDALKIAPDAPDVLKQMEDTGCK